MNSRSHAQPALPRVSIWENPDTTLTVVLDGKRQDAPADYARAGVDPWQPARDVARLLGQSVFAELTDATGDTYTHVFDPDDPTHPTQARPAPLAEPHTAPEPPAAPPRAVPRSEPAEREPAFSICGDGFAPGEDVYVAVVVSTRTARPDGMARLPLPGALLNRLPGVLILFGLDSGTLIVSDPTATTTGSVPGEHAA